MPSLGQTAGSILICMQTSLNETKVLFYHGNVMFYKIFIVTFYKKKL